MTSNSTEPDLESLEKSIEKAHLQIADMSIKTGVNIAKLEGFLKKKVDNIKLDSNVTCVIAQAAVIKLYNLIKDANELAKLRTMDMNNDKVSITSVPLIDFVVKDAEENSKKGVTYDDIAEYSQNVQNLANDIAGKKQISKYNPEILNLLPKTNKDKAITSNDILKSLQKDNYYHNHPFKIMKYKANMYTHKNE